MRESKYQTHLIRELRRLFPGCLVIKNDSSYLQGIPDLLVLFGPCWAMLETKIEKTSHRQPNQEYYVDMLNEMFFAAFIYPENETDVLNALQQAFESRWNSRVP